MSRLVTFKRRALIAGGDDCWSWSCDLKDKIFFLCWCRTRWSALCADGGCLGSPDGATSYSGGGGPGSLGAGALCGGSGLEISGDVAPSDNLGSPSVAALCGSLQTPGAVASCDSLGALRTTAPCAGDTLSCCFSATVKTLCGCDILFLQSKGSIIRVEQSLLLRSNERLHGTNLLSPMISTSKSMAQQQTFDLCRFRGDSCRSLPVCQAVCMSMEAKGFNRCGFAAELC
uniref:Uncharacterized protein n=1 Tax=Oryza nivara TaxID=4536 RepID=A0A0E0GED4_ORYNI